MKHIEIEKVTPYIWECDHCGSHFEQGRKKAPPKCCRCGKDLCKKCKRHIHVEIGSGNGQAVSYQTNQTNNYCPECYVPVADMICVSMGIATEQTDD